MYKTRLWTITLYIHSYIVLICTYIHISVFSLKRVTNTPIYQPHPLTTPVVYTLITLAAPYYRSDVQANYLIQTSLFKLLDTCIVVQLRQYTCRYSTKQAQIAKIQPIQRTKFSPIQFLTNVEV